MIVTLSGTNHFLLHRELQAVINEFIAEHGELAVERIDAEDTSIERIAEAVNSMPFLASAKLVVIHSPGKNKELQESFEQLMDSMSDQTSLVLVEPKPDKRTVFYKLLKSWTELKEFAELDEQALSGWLVQSAKEQGADLSRTDAGYLVGKIGTNQQLLAMELEKLRLFDAQITRKNIDELVEALPQSKIFDLLDAAFQGRTGLAMKIYHEQRQLKVEPQEIMGLIAWQLHVLAVIKTAGDRSVETIAKDAQLNPYVVRKSYKLAHELSIIQLKELLNDALTIDVRSKTEAIDTDEALQNYLIKLGNK